MSKQRFNNLDGIDVNGSLKDLYKWQQERRRKQKDLSYVLPTAQPDTAFLARNRKEPTITWVGHSTFLIQAGGLNIVTDPVWAKRLSMFRRLSEPGIPMEDMPQVDVVLLSHGHYDHLDLGSLRALPGEPEYMVPAGLGSWFKKKGFARTAEFTWWGSREFGGLRFTFVPAQHWTRRTPFDTNTSHWGGWMIEGNTIPNVYFAGDSGYFRGFSEIGTRFEIDCALMPIGAYEPEWFMGPQHVTPEEAVQAFLDTGARQMIPMHYGAYRLADDTTKEALDRLHLAWEAHALPDVRLKELLPGQIFHLDNKLHGRS